jgi:hypothetical protein
MVCSMKEKTLPFELRPTNIEGVYSFVPPPKGLDHRTVSNATLIKHGILVRRPDPIKNPALFQLWRKFIEEAWTEENFTSPVLAPQVGIAHALKDTRHTDGPAIGGYSWSGCALVGSWSGVVGVWVIPEASQPFTPQAAGGGVELLILGGSGWRLWLTPRDHLNGCLTGGSGTKGRCRWKRALPCIVRVVRAESVPRRC